MTATPFADLRARLAPLAAAATELVSELDQIAARENGLLADTDRVAVFRQTLLGASRITTDLRDAIDALLARGEAAEADAETLRGLLSDLRFEYAQIWDGLNAANEDATTLARRLANVPDRWQYQADAEALSAHARRLAASTPDTERP